MLICMKVAMFYHTSAFKAKPFRLSKYRIFNFNSLMTLTRYRFISQQQTNSRKRCDLPCGVSSESRLLQTGVKCRPRPLQMIRTRARLDNRSSAPESRSAYGHTHQVSSQRRRVHGGSTEQKNMLVGLLAAPSSPPPCLPFHVVSPSPPFVPGVWEKRAKETFY